MVLSLFPIILYCSLIMILALRLMRIACRQCKMLMSSWSRLRLQGCCAVGHGLRSSVICRVDACAEISVEDQFTRYRVIQEEASRVGDKAMEESSCSDDSSSSGVDSDLQIDTVHVVVTLTLWCVANDGCCFVGANWEAA